MCERHVTGPACRDVPDPATSRRGRAGMMHMMATDPAAIEALADADPFDQAFIELMVPHHRMGVMMARMAGGSTSRPEIRRLADAIIVTQAAEIELMLSWYEEWY